MSLNPGHRETGDIARRFFVHAVALFAAMLLPYAVLENGQAPFATIAIVVGYVALGMFIKYRRTAKEDDRKVTYGAGVAALLYGLSGFMAVSGIGGAIVIAWLGLAYVGVKSKELPVDFFGDAALAGLPHALTMLAGGVVFLALAIVLLHWGRGGLGALAARIRRHGFGLFLSPWLTETALVMLLFGVTVFLGMALPLDLLLQEMSPGATVTFLDLAETFPFLPLTMLLTAVIAVAWVDLSDYGPFGAVVRTLQDEDTAPAPRDAWWRALATITLSASAGSLAVALWALHVAITAATGSASALRAGLEVGDAVKDWAIQEHVAGRPKEELAALVNAKGYWARAYPDVGLPDFLPGLGGALAELDLDRGCRVRVAAAPAAPEDAAIPMPAWADEVRPAVAGDRETAADVIDDAAGVPGYGETPPLRYCVKVTCPVPVTWETPPALALYSSHPTGGAGWLYWIYFDLYTEGIAAAPGGYCTAEGALAESYQG